MSILTCVKKGCVRTAVLSLLALPSFLIIAGLTAESDAQGVYSAREQIYLKNITPLLYEFSQVASEVSASVLKLQSSTPEECSSKFADYRGIVGSLSGQIASMTPPQRLETVHSFAMQAMEGYSTGLGLYLNACTEEDYGVKESLVSRGGVYLNKSVVNVGKAYDEMELLKSSGPPPVAKEGAAEQITEGEITDGSSPAGTGTEIQQENTAVTNPPAQQPKSKEQVLAEISQKVQADMEAQESAEKNTQAELVEGPDVPLVVTREEKPVPPVKVQTETTVEETRTIVSEKTETPETSAAEPTLEPTPIPPADAPSLKSEEEPAPGAAPTGEEDTGTRTDKAEESNETAEEESGKDKITELNLKIMERAGTDRLNRVAEETKPGEPEMPHAQVPYEGKGAEPPSGSFNTDSSSTGNATPLADDREIAAMPPGEAAVYLKDEEVPADDVISWCRERCETPEEMENCMKLRAVAKDRIDKLSNAYSSGSQEREVLDKCMSDWKEGGTYNYEMVISCTQFFCTQRGIEDCKDLSK